jgi:hypothetical protein
MRRFLDSWGKLVLAGGAFVVGIGGIVLLTQADRRRDEGVLVPYEMTPHSLVRCYNSSGTLIYEDRLVDRDVEHTLTRLPCAYYYGGGCCISDAPKDGTTDSRRWGIGHTDTERVVDIDGRGIECVVIKNLW